MQLSLIHWCTLYNLQLTMHDIIPYYSYHIVSSQKEVVIEKKKYID